LGVASHPDGRTVVKVLGNQKVAGLWLYVVTAELLADALEPDAAPLIEQTVELIKAELKNQ